MLKQVTAVALSLPLLFAGLGTAKASTKHEIQQGDTLSEIGKTYGVSVDSLATYNAISNVNRIYVGDILTIDEDAKQSKPQNKEEVKSDWIPYEFTHYTASCVGCSGITSTGINVTNTTQYNGMRVIAVNPSVIPYGSIVELKYPNGTTERAYAGDTGGAIRSRTNLIDVLVSSTSEAMSKGRVNGEIRFIRKGE